MIDEYSILRKIDYLRTAVDNLQRECNYLISASVGEGICHVDQYVSWQDLFLEQCNKIDQIARIINSYKKETLPKS